MRVYELHIKKQKDDLLREIESVRAEHSSLQDDHLGLKQEYRRFMRMSSQQSIILDILTNNGHVDEVIRRLRVERTGSPLQTGLTEKKSIDFLSAMASNWAQYLECLTGRLLEITLPAHPKFSNNVHLFP